MTRPDDEDIRDLLDRAIGQEPPLSLNRAEIFRSGRRKVRNRRLAASGGVAASVVAVVVGAATLTNLVGGTSNEVTPALGSSTTSAPASPASVTVSNPPETTPALTLPLPPASTTHSPQLPRSVSPEKHAAALTADLAAANPIPKGIRLYPAGDQSTPPLTFAFFRDAYRAGADLSDARGSGNFEVEISYVHDVNTPIGCEQSTAEVTVNCSFGGGPGYQMTKTTRMAKVGTVEYIVRALRSDGTEIWVTATNVAARGTGGRPTSAERPLVEHPILEKIAINPRMTYG